MNFSDEILKLELILDRDDLTDEERERYRNDLDNLLDYMEDQRL